MKYIIAIIIYGLCTLGLWPVTPQADPQPPIEETIVTEPTETTETATEPTGGSQRPQEPETQPADTQPPEPVFDGSTPSSDITVAMNNDRTLLGVLYIPDVGLTPTPIKLCSNTTDLQYWADEKNAAYCVGLYSFYNIDGRLIEIGDHVNHNFGCLKNITVGTIGYINRGDKVVKLKCVSVEQNSDLYGYVDRFEEFNGYVVTITCAPGTNRRTIIKWVVTDDSDISFDKFWKIVTVDFNGRYDGKNRDNN